MLGFWIGFASGVICCVGFGLGYEARPVSAHAVPAPTPLVLTGLAPTNSSMTWVGPRGYKGVDELARRLHIRANPKGGGRLLVVGESGANYDVTDMCQQMLDAVDSTYEIPRP